MAIDNKFLFDNTTFSSTMKLVRQQRGLTLDELSRLSKEIDPSGDGISRVALSRYETNASLPGLRELRLISLSLRTPLSFLVYQEHMDPMLNYRTSIEMRLTEMAFDTVIADGVVKEKYLHDPANNADYLNLLKTIKDSK
jgi:transcriptional regulator with XRE-family HTH domain